MSLSIGPRFGMSARRAETRIEKGDAEILVTGQHLGQTPRTARIARILQSPADSSLRAGNILGGALGRLAPEPQRDSYVLGGSHKELHTTIRDLEKEVEDRFNRMQKAINRFVAEQGGPNWTSNPLLDEAVASIKRELGNATLSVGNAVQTATDIAITLSQDTTSPGRRRRNRR